MRPPYPWKVGATSFVIADSVEENVRFLAGLVDDVQLLFFESSWLARLPNHIDVSVLCDLATEHGHSYTVHLPLDLRLGASDSVVRDRSIAEVCRIFEQCQSLSPLAYDLHLNREMAVTDRRWRDNCRQSLSLLQVELGYELSKLCVENIDYDFELIAPEVKASGAKVCVDFGHLHHCGFNDAGCLSRYDTQHIHLHGLAEGRDHHPLSVTDIPFLKQLALEMVVQDYSGVVTLELYKSQWLTTSLAVLDKAWSEFNKD